MSPWVQDNFKAIWVNNRIAMEDTERVCVLFIGTQFSNLYTAVDSNIFSHVQPAEGAVRIVKEHVRCLLR